jgi:hypothetical protein
MIIRRLHRRAASAPTSWPRRLSGNPYLFLGPRPFREERLRAYIVRQHRAGRPIGEIVRDPYVRRCGSETFCWRVIEDPRTIRALEQNIRAAFGEFGASAGG